MANLSDNARFAVWSEIMQELSDAREPVSIVKADLRAAVNAIDTWISDNAASLNSAIPQPARGALTAAQKSRIFRMVAKRRYEDGA
jgi:hypothetical protein